MEKLNQIIQNMQQDSNKPKNRFIEIFDKDTIWGNKNYLKFKLIQVGKSIIPDFELKGTNLTEAANILFWKILGYGTQKGLYLWGSKGIGKTSLFKVYQQWINKIAPFCGNSFQIISVDNLIEAIKANETQKYLLNFDENKKATPRHLLINEFGKKANEKNYGTDIDRQIERFLMQRYEIFTDWNKVTHCTSNINPIELEFDDLLMDRFVEMFEFHFVDGESLRK